MNASSFLHTLILRKHVVFHGLAQRVQWHAKAFDTFPILTLSLILFLSPFSIAQQPQQNWVKLAQVGTQFSDLSCVQFLDSLHGYLGGGSLVMTITDDGGHTWQQSQGLVFFPQAISMHDTLFGWAACTASGIEGAIAKTTDGGRSWAQDQVMINRPLWDVATLSRSRCIAVGDTIGYPDRGVILSTTDGGLSWKQEVRTDTISSFKQIQFTDSLHGWILYWFDGGSGLLTTVDGGRSWEKRRTREGFTRFRFVDSLSGFGIAPYPSLYKTTDGGRSWVYLTFIDPANQPIPKALSFVDTLNGWLFAINSSLGDLTEAIYRTRDGGLTWQQESIGLASDLFAAQMLDTLHGWAACSGGIVLGYRPMSTAIENRDGITAARAFQLYQNYPNPFNSTTTIEYQLAREGEVTLSISDLVGRTIAVLVDKRQQAGFYRLSWEASQGVGSGVYFYTLSTQGGACETRRLMLLK